MSVERRRFHARCLARTVCVAVLALLMPCLWPPVPQVAAGAHRETPSPGPWGELLAEIVPEDGPARPPYQPARYDLDCAPRAQDERQSLTKMAERAAIRQDRLRRKWGQLKNNSPDHKNSKEVAGYKLLAYAFGEIELDEAVRAAERADVEARFRLARLLLAECRFDDAVRVLVPLADAPQAVQTDGIPRQALAVLARHDAERAALAKHMPLVPLAFDLSAYLERRSQDPAAKSFIQAVRKTTPIRLPADLETLDGEVQSFEIGDPEDVPSAELDVDPTLDCQPSLEIGGWSVNWKDATLYDVGRLYLSAGGRELVLYQQDNQEWNRGDGVRLTLHAELHGPIAFSLYRFTGRAVCEEAGAAGLGKLKPHRTWSRTFAPLTENNVAAARDWPVEIKDLGEGYYLLTARARYAPMLAACKFCVSNVAVYLRAGRNKAVAVAVDRRDGSPVLDLPLRLCITGRPDAKLLCEQAKPAVEDAFLRGFRGEAVSVDYERGPPEEIEEKPKEQDDDPFAGTAPARVGSPASRTNDRSPVKPEPRRFVATSDGLPATGDSDRQERDTLRLAPLANHVREAESYAQGLQARRRHPDTQHVREARTGPDGSVTFAVDLGRRGYRFELEVQCMGEGLDAGPLSRVPLEYRGLAADGARMQAVVWTAQPLYRPGDTVQFAGIVRQREGTRLADHALAGQAGSASRQHVAVRVGNRQGTVWGGRCELSPVGTVHGQFRIPLTARMGPCWFVLDEVGARPRRAFLVDEFRLATHHVVLSLPRRTYAGGERIEGQAAVTYLTGKPAAEAEVEIALEMRDEQTRTAAGLTDANGVFRFALEVPACQARSYGLLRATASDAAGQSYTCTEHVACEADAFRVTLRPSEGCEGKDDDVVQFDVEVRSWAGEPLPGAAIVAEGMQRPATTDRQGKASLSWRLRAEDRADKTRTARVLVTSGGKVVSRSWQIRPRDTTAGDQEAGPAPLRIAHWKAPARIDAGQSLDCALKLEGPKDRRVSLAVFVESDRLLSSRVLALPPGEHRISFPTEKDWAPSAEVVAVLLEGRRCTVETAPVYLHPTEKFLKLDVQTDKAEYRPGERCTAVVTAVDHQGRPVPSAEISLGVVDEAIYKSCEDPLPDLFEVLYECRVPHLCTGGFDSPPLTSDSLQFLLGPRYAWGYYWHSGYFGGRGFGARRALLAQYGGTKHSERSGMIEVRSRFQNAAHWVADLRTDAEGKARTTFMFPDNVTAWRLTARGVTADTLVGDMRVTRSTILPLAADLALPRALRVGDRIDLPVVVHNNSGNARQIRGSTRVGQAKEEHWPERLLPSKGDVRLLMSVVAIDRRPIEVFASVKDNRGDQDAVRKQLVPLARGRLVTRAWSGRLDGPATVRADMAAEQGESLVIVVCREPGLAGPVQSALEQLVQYPYGCVEQTMSRFMPAVVASEAMKKAGLRNPAAERLPEVIAQGLARLATFQHADGGWGWWKDDPTNDFMTAYVLEGLTRCRDLDQPVDRDMIQRASQYLLERLQAERLQGQRPASIGDVDLDVYAAHALARVHAKGAKQPACFDEDPFGKVAEQPEGSDRDLARRVAQRPARGPLDRILLADARRLLGGSCDARLIASLSGLVAPKTGDRQSIFAAAAMLELGAQLEPKDPRWPLLARQLIAVRSGNDWGDTLTTSAAVRGIAAVLVAPPSHELPVTVRVDGRQVGVLTSANGNRIELEVSRVGMVTLDCGTCGAPRSGPASDDFYTVRAEGFTDAPPPAPADPAVALRTRVFRLQQRKEELTPDAGNRMAVPRGATLEIQLEVELQQAVSHARLTLPRPCGLELVRAPRLENGLVAIESRDDAVHFFIDQWRPGKHQIAFPARAEVAGTISAPAPELVPMYGDSLPTAVAGAATWIVQGP